MDSLKIMHNMMHANHFHRFVPKNWGFEYWFENNHMYCGKIIQVRGDEWSSHGAFHYHKIKDETFLVLSGTLLLDVLNVSRLQKIKIEAENSIVPKSENAAPWVNRYYMKPYNYIRLRPGVLHRFSSLEKEAIFTETSTTHMEEDSYRIEFPSPDEQLNIYIGHKHGQENFPVNTEIYSFMDKKRED
jgi:D-lyxose ketol-isomerase